MSLCKCDITDLTATTDSCTLTIFESGAVIKTMDLTSLNVQVTGRVTYFTDGVSPGFQLVSTDAATLGIDATTLLPIIKDCRGGGSGSAAAFAIEYGGLVRYYDSTTGATVAFAAKTTNEVTGVESITYYDEFLNDIAALPAGATPDEVSGAGETYETLRFYSDEGSWPGQVPAGAIAWEVVNMGENRDLTVFNKYSVDGIEISAQQTSTGDDSASNVNGTYRAIPIVANLAGGTVTNVLQLQYTIKV